MTSLSLTFDWILAATLRTSILVLVILIVQRLLRSQLSPKWKYALWLPALAAILIPAQPLLPHWVRLSPEQRRESSTIESSTTAVTVNVAPDDNDLDRHSRSPDSIPSATSSTDRIVENKTNAETGIPIWPETRTATVNEEETEASAAHAEVEPAWTDVTQPRSWDWRALAVGAWLLGVALLGAIVPISYWMTLRRVRRCVMPVEPSYLAQVELLVRKLGLRRVPRVWLSPAVQTPAVCGFWRPTLLLNANFFQALTQEEADFVLRHELMHIRRGDVLLNTMLFGLLSLHWFNPLLWFAFFRAGADREAACDEDVLRTESPARRVAYGKTLLRLEAVLPQSGLCLGFVGMVQKGKRLRERIQFIANPKRMGFSMKSLVLLCMCVTAIFGIAKSAEPQLKPKTQQSTLATDQRRTEESKGETPQQEPLKFRKVASLESPGEGLSWARIAVSLDQESVIASVDSGDRGGTNGGVQFRPYDVVLQNLDPESPKRTSLGHGYFGFVPQSNLAFLVRWGDGVRFWNTLSHAPSGDYMPHELREDTVILPAMSPDGKVMVTRSKLDHLQFWNIETRKPITAEIKQAGTVYRMEFSSDGKWFFSRTPKRLAIREAKTGKLVAGPLRHGARGFAYSPKNKQLVTCQNNASEEEVWRSELVIRSGKAFEAITRVRLDGHAREAMWIGDTHLLVVGDNKAPGQKGPFSYGRKIVYSISLGGEKPESRTLMRHDWIPKVAVAPDQRHFIIETRDNTSCWKVGHWKPQWTKSGDQRVTFGDKGWVLLHNGPAIAYSLADGKELWRKENVEMARAIGSHIWTCDENKMEIWKVAVRAQEPPARPPAQNLPSLAQLKTEKPLKANETKAEIVSISTVGTSDQLQSDADIIRFKDHFYIAFAKPIQEGENAFHILQSVDGRDWKSAATLRSKIEERRPDITHSPHYSGRPVWFSTMPSGRLCVTGRASKKASLWSTDNGNNWREELDIDLSRTYSRIHWQNNRTYSASDESSSCGEKFEYFRVESAVKDSPTETTYKLAHNTHTLTGPRESQLAFTEDRAFCLLSFETYQFDKVRRWLVPTNSYATGKFGVSEPPYNEWTWTPTNLKFGRPNLLVLKDERMISSVFVDGDKAHSAICQLDTSTGQMTELLRLPTGDTAQPIGMTEHDGHIWACFYDGPENRKNPPKLKVAKIKLRK